jgi:hypothetical protein
MKKLFLYALTAGVFFTSCNSGNQKAAETNGATATNTADVHYFIDVHNLEPGKVTYADVVAAHKKDLATEGKYGVSFEKFWVDEAKGKVYCLSQAKDSASIANTHKEAHGLMPAEVHEVTCGQEAALMGDKPMFIDVHEMGAGNVKAADVAAAHQKDLAVEQSHGVNFLNYYVDEKAGLIWCVSEAADSNAIKATHKEAHGLMPVYVMEVKQGQ